MINLRIANKIQNAYQSIVLNEKVVVTKLELQIYTEIYSLIFHSVYRIIARPCFQRLDEENQFDRQIHN